MGKFLFAYSLILTAALAFVLGRGFSPGGETLEGMTLRRQPMASIPSPIQGRKPPSRGKTGTAKQGLKGTGDPTEGELLPYEPGTGGMSQANGVIAITGSYGVGTSILYVIDTRSKQMAVYEARGGSKSGHRLFLVGARRIDLDLQLEGYHDESEYSYQKLRQAFEKKGFFTAEGGESDGEPGK